MPQIPNDTRWNSHAECARTFVSNYHLYAEIEAEHPNDFSPEIKKKLDHVGIYREATNLAKQLDVVSAALDKVT